MKNNLMDKPGQIFNCDELGFPLDHKPGKVIGLKGQKSVNLTTSGDKAQITISRMCKCNRVCDAPHSDI